MERHAAGQAGRVQAQLRVAQLARQVNDSDLNARIIAHAVLRPFAGVAADIQQPARPMLLHQRQGAGKRCVGKQVIKRKPRAPDFFGQVRQGLIDRGPFAKFRQPGRARLAYRFVQFEQAAIADVVAEIHVRARQGIVQQKARGLGRGVAAIGFFHQPDPQSGFQQHAHAVLRELDPLGGFLQRQSGTERCVQRGEDAAVAQHARGLKHKRSERDPLRVFLGLQGVARTRGGKIHSDSKEWSDDWPLRQRWARAFKRGNALGPV